MGNLTEIATFFNHLKSLIQGIAPVIAFLGFVTLGLIYLGSSILVLSDWKRNNQEAASQVVTGLIFVLLASSIASFISFT